MGYSVAVRADIAQGVADVAGWVSPMDMMAIKAQGRAVLRSKTGVD